MSSVEEDGDNGADVEVFRGHDGHTLRLLPWFEKKPLRIKRMGSVTSLGIPVTEIDSYFDEGLVRISSNFACRGINERPLNQEAQWSEVVDKLFALAVKIDHSRDPSDEGCTWHFEIPVTGHWPVDTRAASVQPKDWFCYKGRYYDPEWVYELVYQGKVGIPHTLRPICRRDLPRSAVCADGSPEDVNFLEYGEELKSQFSYVRHLHKNCFEIDLGEVCHIQALITSGVVTRMELFPAKRHAKNVHSIHKKRWRQANRCTSQEERRVYVVPDQKYLSWTTSFSMHIRSPTTGHWVPHPVVFDGNHDVATEKCNPLDVVTRHIRIFPLEFHNSMDMHVRVLGERIRTARDENAVAGDTKCVEETVSYTLLPEQTQPYRSLGRSHHHKHPWNLRYENDSGRSMRDHIREGLQEFEEHTDH